MVGQSFGKTSYLDVTVLVSASGNNVMGFVSRRPLVDKLMDVVLSNIAFLSYDRCEDTTNDPPVSVAPVIAFNNRDYEQNYRRDFSGTDGLANIQNLYNSDGIVANGFTSNIESSVGTGRSLERPYNSGNNAPGPWNISIIDDQMESLSIDSPKDSVPSLFEGFYKRLVPRKGNYCGPGWTAGVDTFRDETVITSDGKYIVHPSGEEDAICKSHDEAYRRSQGKKDDVRAADHEMIGALDELDARGGLTLYGRAARMAIQAKHYLLS